MSQSRITTLQTAFRRFRRKLRLDKKAAKMPIINSPDTQQVFRHLDENGDGKISAEELRNMVRRVGGSDSELSQEEAELAVRLSDFNGDGALGIEDFAKLMEEGGGEDELRGVFQMYAADDTECITPKSLKKIMNRLSASDTLENCRNMISKFDVDGDGVLNFEEFRKMMECCF